MILTYADRAYVKARIDEHVRHVLDQPVLVELCEKCFEPFDTPARQPSAHGRPRHTCEDCKREVRRERGRRRRQRRMVARPA